MENFNPQNPTWAPRITTRQLLPLEQHIGRITNNNAHFDLFDNIPLNIRREMNNNREFEMNFFFIDRIERRNIFDNRETNFTSSLSYHTKHDNIINKNVNNQ